MLLCAPMAVRGTTVRPPPLAHIEAPVQAGAEDLALDVAGPEGGQRLRALIDDEVERWRADHRRGLHVVDPDGVADRGLPEPGRVRTAGTAAGRPRRLRILVNAPGAAFGGP